MSAITKADVLSMLQTAFIRYHAKLPGLYPKRKKISVTFPSGQTTYTVSDAWITSDTDCYTNDLATKSLATTVAWTFSNGSVTFTVGTALSSALTFNFGMVKGGVG